jgi:putative Holliday junction resolvase
MKYLGIDYGTKRVGVAISDDAGEFAFPKAILPIESALTEIAAICEDEGIEAIVIGEPRASNGELTDTALHAVTFKDKIAEITELPVVAEREDFSSVEAHRYQTAAGSRDDSAAAIILQRFLDKKKK